MCLSYFETLWLMAFSLAYLNQLVSECHLPATVTFKMIFHGQHKKKSWSHSYRAISSAKFYLRCSCTHNHFCDKRHPKRKHATQINSSIIECVSSPVFFSHCANIMQIKWFFFSVFIVAMLQHSILVCCWAHFACTINNFRCYFHSTCHCLCTFFVYLFSFCCRFYRILSEQRTVTTNTHLKFTFCNLCGVA